MYFGGGFPFGGGFERAGPSRDVDTDAYYKLLGVDKDAPLDEIKRAFKKLAIKLHPDKGGDAEQFKEVCKAYEVLSDPEKRRLYDQYGEEGLEGSSSGASANDIFRMFFGGGGGGSGIRKGEDYRTELEFTLEQFFNGTTRKLAISKDVICSVCKGHGGPEEAITECSMCNGHGVRVVTQRRGPMITQTQSPCNACDGKGKAIPDSKRCQTCRGNGTCREKKQFDLQLPRGARNGHKIVFRGEADEKPGMVSGDVVIICRQKPHPVFQRRGQDLFMKKGIPLRDALCGTAFTVKGLDGETKFIESAPGQIIKPDDTLAVQGEGLPQGGSMFLRGNLYIQFDIVFPESLSEEQIKALRVLPGSAVEKIGPKQEKFVLKRIDPETTNQANGMEEDDDEGGHRNVQCHQA